MNGKMKNMLVVVVMASMAHGAFAAEGADDSDVREIKTIRMLRRTPFDPVQEVVRKLSYAMSSESGGLVLPSAETGIRPAIELFYGLSTSQRYAVAQELNTFEKPNGEITLGSKVVNVIENQVRASLRAAPRLIIANLKTLAAMGFYPMTAVAVLYPHELRFVGLNAVWGATAGPVTRKPFLDYLAELNLTGQEVADYVRNNPDEFKIDLSEEIV